MGASSISRYDLIVFDCDGVILNSNKVKTLAFYEVARRFGEEPALELAEFNRAFGGVSRHKKFNHFVDFILPSFGFTFSAEEKEELIGTLIADFGRVVEEKLVSCEITNGLPKLKEYTPLAIWAVASGGLQSELRSVFEKRGITQFFQGGVYGSPRDKLEIVKDIVSKYVFESGLLIGDTRYDCSVAEDCGLDFILLTKWSEQFCDSLATYPKCVGVYKSLEEIVALEETFR